MPVIKCCDCGKGRRLAKHDPRVKRCKPCQHAADIKRLSERRIEFARKKLCRTCGQKLSLHSIFYCDLCLAYHAGYQAFAMRQKRAASPDYREDERVKVKARMRRIRAERRAAGLNNRGKPFASEGHKRNSDAQLRRQIIPE